MTKEKSPSIPKVLEKKRWINKSTRMYRQTTPKAIHRQGRYKLTNCINGGNDDIMHNRCKRNRYIVVSDIQGIFLHANINDNIHMLLEGIIEEMVRPNNVQDIHKE